MSWIESHTALREHPKTKRLCRLLKINRREAVGLLHMLWWWALEYTPEGDLGAVSDEDIAEAVDWRRDPAALVAALTEAGFLDPASRRLHDWHDYAGRWIERRAANAERKREARAARPSGGRPPDVGRTPPGRQQLPDHTGPDHTGPDHTGPDLTGPPPPTPPATEREGPGSLPRADAPANETGGAGSERSNGARRAAPVMRGRDGWAGCPAGCPANHGGPRAANFLGEGWISLPPEGRPAWPDYLSRHGRPDLADLPAPALGLQQG